MLTREILGQMGCLLEYPKEDPKGQLMGLIAKVALDNPEAAGHLESFYSKMKRMDLNMWQEFYVNSFDLMTTCSLYVSVHLFGEESFKRAELMVGLKAIYEKEGEYALVELPDHLSVVLKKSSLFAEEEWRELTSMCLLPSINIMISKLEKAQNTYAVLLKALISVLVEMESTHV